MERKQNASKRPLASLPSLEKTEIREAGRIAFELKNLLLDLLFAQSEDFK
jgi:hypothetical protein